MSRWVPALVLLAAFSGGCKKVPYVVYLEGVWVGTAAEAGGNAYVMTADFKWNEEQEYFGGTADIDGWVYNLVSVSSDKESATIEMLQNTNARSVTLSEVAAEETTMTGKFDINTCYGQPQPCPLTGTFNLEMQ